MSDVSYAYTQAYGSNLYRDIGRKNPRASVVVRLWEEGVPVSEIVEWLNPRPVSTHVFTVAEARDSGAIAEVRRGLESGRRVFALKTSILLSLPPQFRPFVEQTGRGEEGPDKEPWDNFGFRRGRVFVDGNPTAMAVHQARKVPDPCSPWNRSGGSAVVGDWLFWSLPQMVALCEWAGEELDMEVVLNSYARKLMSALSSSSRVQVETLFDQVLYLALLTRTVPDVEMKARPGSESYLARRGLMEQVAKFVGGDPSVVCTKIPTEAFSKPPTDLPHVLWYRW